jgi:multiple sugar transport system substrate-binding protein
MKHILTPLAILTLILQLLAACGQAAPASTAATPAQPMSAQPTPTTPVASKTTIRLATWAGAEEAKELQAVINKVNAEATTFQIVQESQPWGEYHDQIEGKLAGANPPDLVWLDDGLVVSYAEKGHLLDITEQLAASSHPAAQTDDYFPSALDTARYQGKLYGLPWIASPVMLYYNPALFEAADIAPPDESWTWDDFKAAAADLTRDLDGDGTIDQYGTALDPKWPPIEMFIWQAGGELISDDLQHSRITTPESLQGAAFFAELIDNPRYAAPVERIKEQGLTELALSGKVAMTFGGASDSLDIAYLKDPTRAAMKIVVVPRGPKSRTTFIWTASTAISAKTKHPEAALDALVALSDGIHRWKIAAPRASLANAATIVASAPEKSNAAKMIALALTDARAIRTPPSYAAWNALFEGEYVNQLAGAEVPIADLAARVEPQLEAVLAP